MKPTNKQPRATFAVYRTAADFIAVIDQDAGVSITNDAAAVVTYLLAEYGSDRRFFYRDTMGRWDELLHDGHRFTDFAPLSDAQRLAIGAGLGGSEDVQFRTWLAATYNAFRKRSDEATTNN
jgi:hypothetical protein